MVVLLRASSTSSNPCLASSNLYHISVNHNRGRAQNPGRERGCGHPPTTFDESFVTALFDYHIRVHIRHQVLALEEDETRKFRPMLWALHNLLARQLKERDQDKLRATRWISEFFSFPSLSYTSLKCLARDLKIDFPPNMSPPPLLLYHLHTPHQLDHLRLLSTELRWPIPLPHMFHLLQLLMLSLLNLPIPVPMGVILLKKF